MRIHSIEIENITSLKGKHVVDLREGLQGEELFAITGSTGAGKSSLLSAISLALYGKTYKGSLASNDFVTTGTPFAAVNLDFTLAGKNYQAKWSIKVLKKNGDPIKNPKPQRELICEGIALEQVSITDILGLDFDQFCKTIILNQGEFAKFLHSSFRERKDIIEKLYRTGELSIISKNLKEKIKTEDANLKLLTLGFEKSLPYTDEEISQITNELDSKLENLKIHEELTALLEPSYNSITQLYAKLKEESEYHKKIKISEQNLKSLIDSWNKLKEVLSSSKKKYDKINQTNKDEVPKLRSAISVKSNLENSKKTLTIQKDELRNLITKEQEDKNELNSRKESQKLFVDSLQNIKNSFTLKELFLTKTKNEIFIFKEDITKLKAHLSEQDRILGQKEILTSQMASAKGLISEREIELSKVTSDLSIDPEKVDDSLLELRRNREAKLSLWTKFEGQADKLAEHLQQSTELTEENNQLSTELKHGQSELDLLIEKEKGQRLMHAIAECQKEALENGECPVCKNTDLSNFSESKSNKEVDLEQLDNLKTKASTKQFQFEQNKKRIDEAKIKINDLRELLEKSKKVIFKKFNTDLDWGTSSEVNQGMKILKEVFNSNLKEELSFIDSLTENKKKLDSIKVEFKRAKENLNSLSSNERALTEAISKVQALIDTFLNNWKELLPSNLDSSLIIKNFDSDMERFTEQIQIEQKIDSNSESIERLKKQIREIQNKTEKLKSSNIDYEKSIKMQSEKLFAICENDDPIALLEKLEREEKSALKTLQEATEDFNKNEKKKANEEQSLRIFKEQTVEIQNLQKTYIKSLVEQFDLLSKYDGKIPNTYPLYEECHDIIKESLKWPDLSHDKALDRLLPILEARLESTWESLMEKLKEVSLDLKTTVHTNKKRIEEYNAKVKDRAGLEEELKAAKSSLQLKNRLLEVFGKDEFRSYALGLLEEELVLGANQELNDLCDGRYQLKLLPGKGSQMEFFALDLWRESTLRKINTLSGGETFLVSLAMALALAELTRGQNEIDSFFIDEGFGHLDSESIDDVLEVLMNIQNRGKQIGIISHVKTLTDRIPVNLTLQKSSLGESTTEFRYN